MGEQGRKTVWICADGKPIAGVIVPNDCDLSKLADSWKSAISKNPPGKKVTAKVATRQTKTPPLAAGRKGNDNAVQNQK